MSFPEHEEFDAVEAAGLERDCKASRRRVEQGSEKANVFLSSRNAFNPGVQRAAKHHTSQEALVPHHQDSQRTYAARPCSAAAETSATVRYPNVELPVVRTLLRNRGTFITGENILP